MFWKDFLQALVVKVPSVPFVIPLSILIVSMSIVVGLMISWLAKCTMWLFETLGPTL